MVMVFIGLPSRVRVKTGNYGTFGLQSEPLHELLSVDYHRGRETVAREVTELQLVIHVVELEHHVYGIVGIPRVGDFVVALLLGLDVLLALMWLLGTVLGYLVETLLLLVEVEGGCLAWRGHGGEEVVTHILHRRGGRVGVIGDEGNVIVESHESLHVIIGESDVGEVNLAHIGGDEVVVGFAVAHSHVGHLLLLRLVIELNYLNLQLVVLLLGAVVLVDDVEGLHTAVAVDEVSAESVPDDASEVSVALDVVYLLADLLVGVPLGVVRVKRHLAPQDLLRQALTYFLGRFRLLRLLFLRLLRLVFLLALAHIP